MVEDKETVLEVLYQRPNGVLNQEFKLLLGTTSDASVRKVLEEMRDQDTIVRDPTTNRWRLNDADQPAAAPPEQGSRLTASYSPAGVGVPGHPLHHRQR